MKTLLFLYCFYLFYICNFFVTGKPNIRCNKLTHFSFTDPKCLQKLGEGITSSSLTLTESIEAKMSQVFNDNLNYPNTEHNILLLVFYSMIFIFSFFGNIIMIIVMYFGMRSSFLDVSIYLINLGKSI